MASLFKRMKLRCNYPFGVVYKLTENRPYGMMILSKHPIHKWKRISFGENTGNMAMWVDVKMHSKEFAIDKTIRVYNVHLQSFRFNKSELTILLISSPSLTTIYPFLLGPITTDRLPKIFLSFL